MYTLALVQVCMGYLLREGVDEDLAGLVSALAMYTLALVQVCMGYLLREGVDEDLVVALRIRPVEARRAALRTRHA